MPQPGQVGAPLHSVPRAVSIDVGESGRRVQTEGEPLLLLPGREDEVHDQVLSEAVADGVQSIVNVGCGTDTKAYRFSHLFKHRDVRVLECDRAEAIRAKQRIVRRWQHSQHIEYLQIDLNADTWPELACWLEKQPGRTLVLMEGVSPYIDDVSFGRFLSLLASTLAAGSQVAYDFKIQGAHDDLGREGRTQRPFRLPTASDDVAAFHEAHGLPTRAPGAQF